MEQESPITVSSIPAYLEEIYKIFDNRKSTKHLFFRGHSNAKEHQLLLSILRWPRLKEEEILLDYKQYAPAHQINYDYIKERDKMLADIQHYGITTRLIDWTLAPHSMHYFLPVPRMMIKMRK